MTSSASWKAITSWYERLTKQPGEVLGERSAMSGFSSVRPDGQEGFQEVQTVPGTNFASAKMSFDGFWK